MTVYIKPLVDQHISSLISSATGFMLDTKQTEILEFCQRMSAETWTGYVDDKLICCWGLIPPSILSNQVYLWMHSTTAVRDHQFLLVRHSQKVIESVFNHYDTIVGHCRAEAKDSKRWLRWLGAEFGPIEQGYVPFQIKRKLHG